jgi:hypothetical protein
MGFLGNCRVCERRHLLPSVLAIAVAAGCGHEPQVAPSNRRLIESLRTAVSARKIEWLETNSKLVEERRQAGELSDQEYAAFSSIVARARAGDWKGAQSEAINLANAQRPTEQDLKNLQAPARKPRQQSPDGKPAAAPGR